ncbi:hypothetical protein, partial [Mesorhizobium japonicum]|uniref:hypothetical protein n=1 Tax=Mesorhizobium japonicum TaxID=2066070 RepID=UPI003B59462B
FFSRRTTLWRLCEFFAACIDWSLCWYLARLPPFYCGLKGSGNQNHSRKAGLPCEAQLSFNPSAQNFALLDVVTKAPFARYLNEVQA